MSTNENLFDRRYFPTLKNNPDLLYFDNAATTHTHRWVVDRMDKFYREERCTVHRGDGRINDRIAEEIEAARSRVANLINASPEQILFCSGATQGLNWLAEWYKNIGTVIITEAEHNANILPWIAQGRKIGAGLEILPLDYNTGPCPVPDYNKALELFTKHQGNALLSISSHSNLLGTPIGYAPNQEIFKQAKRLGITTCLDACQTIGHAPIDVEELHTDWVVFSGHKMYGPMGVGAIYFRDGVDKLRPINFGGGQIEHMSFDNVVFASGAHKHEVGTPNIPGILGLGIAAELINYVGYSDILQREERINVAFHQSGLLTQLRSHMECVAYNKYSTIMGSATVPAAQSIFTFVTEAHPSDISALLSQQNVSVRAGKMCAHLLSNRYGDKGLLRLSIAPYTTERECYELASILAEVLDKLY